jgi:hypothetical protein
MSKEVCLLARWEADDLVEKRIYPKCEEHRHVKKTEAVEMTSGAGAYSRPVAEWIGNGERRILLLVNSVQRWSTVSDRVVIQGVTIGGVSMSGKRLNRRPPRR